MSIVIPYQKVVEYLRKTFPLLRTSNELTNCPIELYDAWFKVVNQEDVATVVIRIANEFRRLGLRYEREIFDCEDFARLFTELFNIYSKTNSCLSCGGRVDAYPIEDGKISPIGLVLGYHGYNILIFCKSKNSKLMYPGVKVDDLDNLEVYVSLIEPQAVKYVNTDQDVNDVFLDVVKLNNYYVFGYEVNLDGYKYLITYHTEKVMI